MINRTRIVPIILCQDINPLSKSCRLFATKCPAFTINASLINLPIIKEGIIFIGLMRAIPVAVNNGVEGNGTRVYTITNKCTFQLLAPSLDPMNSRSLFLAGLINLFDINGIYALYKSLPQADPNTPNISTTHILR